jgi:hypothetical protein
MGYETVQRTNLEFPLIYNDGEFIIEADVELYWEEDDLGFEDNLFYSKRYELSGYFITSFRVTDGYIESDVPATYDCESHFEMSKSDREFLGVIDAKVAELVEDIDPPTYIADGFDYDDPDMEAVA